MAIDGERLDAGFGAVLVADRPVEVTGGVERTECLVLQGRPIGEPVAQYGPFVLNDSDGVDRAVRDYQRTRFGGWPWEDAGPVHPADAGRFARHPDGAIEQPP